MVIVGTTAHYSYSVYINKQSKFTYIQGFIHTMPICKFKVQTLQPLLGSESIAECVVRINPSLYSKLVTYNGLICILTIATFTNIWNISLQLFQNRCNSFSVIFIMIYNSKKCLCGKENSMNIICCACETW